MHMLAMMGVELLSQYDRSAYNGVNTANGTTTSDYVSAAASRYSPKMK